MTSQDPVTSKSHTFQDHHGDVRSSQLRARRDRVPRGRTVSCSVLAFFGLMFPGLSLSHCFFLSFFLFEIERFHFPFLVSLLFLFVLVHGHFCSVVVGFSTSQPPFPSSQYVIPLEKYTSMTSVDCRVISSSHVQFDEMKVRIWRSYVRIQASDGCKSAFEVAPLLAASQQLIDPATLADAKLVHAHEWKQQEAPLPHCRFEKSRQASPSLWTDKAKSPCACRFASTSNDHSARWSPTVRLNSKLSKATLTSRTEKIRRQNIRLNSMLLHFKRKVGEQRYGHAKKFEEKTKVTCWWSWWCRFAKFVIEECAARGHVRGHATVLHGNNTED